MPLAACAERLVLLTSVASVVAALRVDVRAQAPDGKTGQERQDTGVLCHEAITNSLDAEVILQPGGVRDLSFSEAVRSAQGELLGRASAGIQSRVRCQPPPVPGQECLFMSGRQPETCSSISAGRCHCDADVSALPDLPYQQMMLRESLGACASANNHTATPFRVLLIGLGGGAMPMYLHRHCKNAVIESVEPDGVVVSIAERLLGFRRDSRSLVEIADGLEAVLRRAAAPKARKIHYALVLVDCFAGGHVPATCSSKDFVGGLRNILASGGRVLQNSGGSGDSLLMSYHEMFSPTRVSTSRLGSSQLVIQAQI